MRLLLIGPPGSGKGTQAARLAQHYAITHISSGDLLRRHVEQDTSIGRAVAECLRRGDLVPDSIITEVLRDPVEAASRDGGYILDGFPRTAAQAETAHRITEPFGAQVRIALHLTAGRAELIHRLRERGRQIGRTDDTDHVIGHRLDLFDHCAASLLDFYRQREILITVDGDRPVSEVTDIAITHLDRARRDLGLSDHVPVRTRTVPGGSRLAAWYGPCHPVAPANRHPRTAGPRRP